MHLIAEGAGGDVGGISQVSKLDIDLFLHFAIHRFEATSRARGARKRATFTEHTDNIGSWIGSVELKAWGGRTHRAQKIESEGEKEKNKGANVKIRH